MAENEKAAEFVAATGLLMMAADGVIDPREKETLMIAVSNFTSQPEKYLYVEDFEAHIKRTETICAYVAKTDDNTKCILLGMVLGVAICDGMLHESEVKLLYTLADMLNMPKEQIDVALNMLLA